MSSRDRTVLVIVCVLAAILAPWLLVLQPKRDQAAKLQSQVNAAQSQLDAARTTLAAGGAARAAFAKSYTTLVRLGEAVPTDDNTPSLIYQLQAAAKATSVDFQSLTFNAASSGASAAPASAGASTAPLPPGATVGPAGFPIEPFTFTFQGNFFHLANFLGRLQRFVIAGNQHLSVSGRLMTLNAITLGPAATAGFPHITATISATTYLLPAAQGLLNGATPTGPAASAARTVSAPSSTSPAPPAVITPTVR
jgi:type II secretory pathway pseudopilin PulG